MLPYVVLILATLFMVAKWSGILDDIAAGTREGRDHEEPRPTRKRRVFPGSSADEERLKIFRDYLEGKAEDVED
jgi:hypothetical protein